MNNFEKEYIGEWPPYKNVFDVEKCHFPLTMHMREWENAVAGILDDYNDGKINKVLMVRNLKSLNKVKIK